LSHWTIAPARRLGHFVALAVAASAVGLLGSTLRSRETPGPGTAIRIAEIRGYYARPASQWPPPWVDAGVAFVEFGRRLSRPMDAAERCWAALGKRLFRDPILSVDQDVSCASCHERSAGWSIAATMPVGRKGRRGRRNPPSLYTVVWQRHMGWDGRGTSLALQALRPLTLEDEMGNPNLEAALQRMRADPDYAAGFRAIKGAPDITEGDLARALVSFLKTLDMPTRFDRFVAGGYNFLSDREIWGLHLFRTKARCANCHFGPLLTDGRFHNLKISFFGEKSQDLGRYEVTGDPDDAGRFRTPSLRHVSETAPYMHNGLFATLEGVINLYDRGGGEVWARNKIEAERPLYPFAARLSPHIRPLHLSPDEKSALAAFLRTL
jgi:cytochrome c peroxidase